MLILITSNSDAQELPIPKVGDCNLPDDEVILAEDQIHIEYNVYYNDRIIDSINICDFPEIGFSNHELVNFSIDENNGLQIIFDSTQLVSMDAIGKKGFIKVYAYPIFIFNKDTIDIKVGDYGLCIYDMEFETPKGTWESLDLTTSIHYLVECTTEPIEKVFIAPKHIAVVLLPKLIEMEQYNFRFGINEHKSIPYKLKK